MSVPAILLCFIRGCCDLQRVCGRSLCCEIPPNLPVCYFVLSCLCVRLTPHGVSRLVAFVKENHAQLAQQPAERDFLY